MRKHNASNEERSIALDEILKENGFEFTKMIKPKETIDIINEDGTVQDLLKISLEEFLTM